MPDLTFLILNAVVLLIALPIHEFAHAWTANYFGDDTPRMYGRLTLNPIAHLDLLGSIMLIVVGFGWAKPVPVNPYALQRRSESAFMWVALAGPLSNALQAIIGAIVLRVLINIPALLSGSLTSYVYFFLIQFIWINIALMLFNLIPLAPLDGDKVADYLMPPPWQRSWEAIRPYGPMLLMVLIFAGRMFHFSLIAAPADALFSLLVGM